ncbi:MAG: GtrA family protein [Comamonas sp.]
MHEKYLFVKYLTVGVANTVVHAIVFFIGILLLSQSLANLLAFFVSASFSFFANARFTFKAAPKKWKYLLYLFFMGGLSYFVGYFCGYVGVAPVLTFILHCLLSLIIGFLFSKFLFEERGMQ